MSAVKTRSPKPPPPWFVHTFWRVHRALYRLSGGRFLCRSLASQGAARRHWMMPTNIVTVLDGRL